MKKITTTILSFIMIIFCAFIFVACEQYTESNDNNSDNTISYNVEVVGGSGSGSYQSGEQATIVSDDDHFLWWQVDGTTTKFSTSKSYTFTVDKNIKIKSYGMEDQYVGFAIMELSSVSLTTQKIYDFSYDTLNSTASINGTKVTATWQGDCIYTTAASNYGETWGYLSASSNNLKSGNFTYELKGGNYVYVFHLYKDLDGSIKAVTTIPNKYSKSAKTTETLATGAKITFQ